MTYVKTVFVKKQKEPVFRRRALEDFERNNRHNIRVNDKKVP